MKNMRDVINRHKEKFGEKKTEKLEKINDVKTEKYFFLEGYTTLKDIMHCIMKTTNLNIRQLVVTSNDTITYLKNHQSKGEKLLKLILVCSKFETEKEKVLAVPQHKPCHLEKEDLTFLADFHMPIIQSSFWAKVAEADWKRRVLVEERNVLTKENRALKRKIARYCMCLEYTTLPPINNKKTNKDRINVLSANEIVKRYKAYDTIGH